MRNCPAHCNLISEHNNHHQGSYAERTFKLITSNSEQNAKPISLLHRFVDKTALFFCSFLWRTNQTQALADTMLRFLGHTIRHTNTHTRTQQDSSERVISSSQRPFPTQHTTDEHPCRQRYSNARSRQSSDCQPKP